MLFTIPLLSPVKLPSAGTVYPGVCAGTSPVYALKAPPCKRNLFANLLPCKSLLSTPNVFNLLITELASLALGNLSGWSPVSRLTLLA